MQMSNEVNIEGEEEGDLFASKDDILDGKSCPALLRKKAHTLNRNDSQLCDGKKCCRFEATG